MDKIKNIHNPEQFAKYSLGDIVVLKSFAAHCIKIGNEFHFKATAPINVSPFMLVVRADRNENMATYDERNVHNFVRYRCMWYDPNKGEFQEEVFFEGSLMRVAPYNGAYNKAKALKNMFQYGDTAHFCTRPFEMSKVFPDNQRFNRFREVVNFIPPDLTVTGFKIAKDIGDDKKHSKDIILTKDGEVIRYDSEQRVVCQWYSTIQGKFLKQDFIPHVLSVLDKLNYFEEV